MATTRIWLLVLLTAWLLAAGVMVAFLLGHVLADTVITRGGTQSLTVADGSSTTSSTSSVRISGPGEATVAAEPAAAATLPAPAATGASSSTAKASATVVVSGRTTSTTATDGDPPTSSSDGAATTTAGDDGAASEAGTTTSGTGSGGAPAATKSGGNDLLISVLAFVLLTGFGIAALAFRTLTSDPDPEPKTITDDVRAALAAAGRARSAADEAHQTLAEHHPRVARMFASTVAVETTDTASLVRRIAAALDAEKANATVTKRLRDLATSAVRSADTLLTTIAGDTAPDHRAQPDPIDRLAGAAADDAVRAAEAAAYAVLGVRTPAKPDGPEGAEPQTPDDEDDGNEPARPPEPGPRPSPGTTATGDEANESVEIVEETTTSTVRRVKSGDYDLRSPTTESV